MGFLLEDVMRRSRYLEYTSEIGIMIVALYSLQRNPLAKENRYHLNSAAIRTDHESTITLTRTHPHLTQLHQPFFPPPNNDANLNNKPPLAHLPLLKSQASLKPAIL